MSGNYAYDPEHPTFLQKIIRFSANNRWLVMATSALLIALGATALAAQRRRTRGRA